MQAEVIAMRVISKVAIGICLIVCSVTVVIAKDWRGIVPLHSTKDDVIRLLGQPTDISESRAKYHLKDEDVYIVFSSKELCNSVRKVNPGTVLMIEVTPHGKKRLQEFQNDLRLFRRFDPSSPRNMGYSAYINDEEGFIIRSYKGIVEKLFYLASAKERGLCTDYYKQPESFAEIMLDYLPRKFDQYSDIPFEDEKARLDNFALYLQKEEPQFKGYLIVYAGQKMRLREVQARAKRAQDYLVKVRHIQAARIVTIHGGRRDQFEVELYALPSSVPPPTPNPHRND